MYVCHHLVTFERSKQLGNYFRLSFLNLFLYLLSYQTFIHILLFLGSDAVTVLLTYNIFMWLSVQGFALQYWFLTLRLLMSYIYIYIYGAPSKARNANVVYIWTYVWQR